MWAVLSDLSRSIAREWRKAWRRQEPPEAIAPPKIVGPPPDLARLEKLVLTDDVCRTLFDEYQEHRHGQRAEEETGWLLMGHRLEREAIALATLPAGAGREAGVAHVRFNSIAPTVASRILRQQDRQLGIVGVVHTHPGSLRHPSSGDYRGDREWVGLLRGNEGVFGIGTADGDNDGAFVAQHPKRHSQCYRGLRFSWYALGVGDAQYHPLPVQLTLGPDLARPLHDVWLTLEHHAEELEQLCRRLKRVEFDLGAEDRTLHVVIPLEGEESLRVVLQGPIAQYYLVRKGQWLASKQAEPRVDRGVYLTLAALADKDK